MPPKFPAVFYQRYVDDIFILFKWDDYIKQFLDLLTSCHIKMSFFMETKRENKLSFLDVETIHKQCKLRTTVYRKPTFSGTHSNFEIFLPPIFKFGMVFNLVYRCFHICSHRTQFHAELIFLKGIFWKTGYPEKIFNKCFKKFLIIILIVPKKVPTVEKSIVLLILTYLWILSLHSRAKLQQPLKLF